MATDIEESDTDDHERPVPPKRQCTRLTKVNETSWSKEKDLGKMEETEQSTEKVEYDDAEKHAREKLKRWQACQVAKGFEDNIINKVIEKFYYIMGAPYSYLFEESRFQAFRGNDMEDTAVMMAIRNHGLVQSARLCSQSSTLYSDKGSEYCSRHEYSETSLATSSTDPLRLNNSAGMKGYNGLDRDLDKIDENDQQKNFLERAVAEAIKKKGLSALSVD